MLYLPPPLSVKAKVRKWRGVGERGRTENGKDEKMSYKLLLKDDVDFFYSKIAVFSAVA